MKSLSYSKHLETLIALITHLAVTDWLMRTPPNLAKALSIEEKEIENTLESFKSLFRKSVKKSTKTGAHFYSLQLRYAQQWREETDDDEDIRKSPLNPKYLIALLEFASDKARQESERKVGLNIAWLTTAGSLIVAIVAIIVR